MYVTRNEIEIALAATGGGTFERFCHLFFAASLGELYIPLGGVHDGGADGVILTRTTQIGDRPTHFFQASIEKDAKAKIRKTIRSLQKTGRDVQQLTYATSQRVAMPDLIEDQVLSEFGVALRIRDGEFLAAHVNDSPQQQQAFRQVLAQFTEHLIVPGGAALPTTSRFMTDPTVFVFLRQQADQDGEEGFIDSVCDALGLWALRGTDPDAGRLMTAAEAQERILEVLPSVADLVTTNRLHARLVVMSAKSNTEGRQVRWHRQTDSFALPFATRQVLLDHNTEDEALKMAVLASLEARATPFCTPSLDPGMVGRAALVALQKSFETRGLQFSAFIEKGDTSPSLPDLDEPTWQAIDEANPGPALRDDVFVATLATVRECLYRGSQDEHEYLRRLARTYTMLFVLRQDPKIVEYLQEMGSNFTLYVGSDILVLAMSERYLEVENQSATNLLRIAAAAGATLILTEPVLEEVVTHLQAADRDFEHNYRFIENHLPTDLFGEIPKIMIRAYFYNRQSGNGPQNWPQFMNQFCDYPKLHEPSAEATLRKYLQAKFSMTYESRDDLAGLAKSSDVARLARDLMQTKSKTELAENDALMVYAVYGKRARNGEGASATVFGYNTWWLTTETRVLRYTSRIVRAHEGARYMMRPDFLLNLITLAPSRSQVKQTYQRLFPATLGLELSRRMDPATVNSILHQLKEAEAYEEPRRLSLMSDMADRMKSDFRRRHLVRLDLNRPSNHDLPSGDAAWP